MSERIVFHIDVNNAFLSWTAVLLLKQGYKKDIRKIPAIIGGDESQRHGIVLAKSPIAKKMGIVTAEPIYQAKKKCPTLQIFPPNHEFYSKCSKELIAYLSQYSPQLEQFSIDECFIEFTGTNYLYKNYLELAYKIKEEIKERFGFTVNIGIANNKLCAKMASDFEKPDKVHTLFSTEIVEKLWPLDVGDLFMIGKSTKKQLYNLNIKTIYDLAHADVKKLKPYFKNNAQNMIAAANGIDNSPVSPRQSKRDSISTTETLSYDCADEYKLKDILFKHTDNVARQLRKQKQYAKTVAVIFKSFDFKSYTAQAKLQIPTNQSSEIYKLVQVIFDKAWKKEPLRLIGVRVADFTSIREEQINLFENKSEESLVDDKIQNIIDDINIKYGTNAIMTASLKKINTKPNTKVNK